MAVTSIGVYGIILGGWASNSKYPLLSSLRASAQLISYEIAVTITLVSVILTAGTLSLVEIVEAQPGNARVGEIGKIAMAVMSDQLSSKHTVARRQITFTMDDQVTLIADAYGDPDHRPVLLSHGGGQTRHSWKTTSERMASLGWYVVAYDHRGHGESDWSKDGEYTVDGLGENHRVQGSLYR